MSYIKKEFIDSLMDKIAIQDVIGDFVHLKKSGANLKGLSPFVDEKSPSFMVSPVKQIYKDFSSGKGGSAINFLMELKGFSYPEAIEHLAKKYTMTIEYDSSEVAQKKATEISKKEAIRPILNKTLELYQQALTILPEFHPAKKELAKREYTQDDIIEWGIGFAPENYLFSIMKEAGKVTECLELGLINKIYDKYKNRVIYPIHDKNGLLIGLAGRDLSGGDTSKWINSQDTILYDKSKVWYGYHRARTEIRKQGFAYIVEGYNDVIALHKYGCYNTISPCGTAITDGQILELSKICDKIVFLMDPDAAGKRSVVKNSKTFLEKGFRVEVATLDLDPDDFCRKYSDIIVMCGSLHEMIKSVTIDGFENLMNEELVGSEIDKSKAAQELATLIAKIKDSAMIEIYSGWLSKQTKIKATTIKTWIKEATPVVVSNPIIYSNYTQYELPKGVTTPLEEVDEDIKKYGVFIDNKQIWKALEENEDGKVRFSSLSNFEIEIINHMRDEGKAKKLVRIKNTKNIEVIFDTDSANFNVFGKFDDMVTDHGDFRFKGNKSDLLKLRDYLFEKMGNGKKIDVLGWQPQGKFWCWNNVALKETGEELPINSNGIIIIDDVHYYIPSANSIYANDSTKYPGQKRFIKFSNDINFTIFFNQVYKVHREHAISAMLFGFTCLFRDVVIDKFKRFPILFLCGPGGTGKDELIEIVQGLTGDPQAPINLEANISTAKGTIRSTAQFRNGISLLAEYKRGNREHDGMLKQYYDNVGYTKGNLDSHVSTDYVPIESGIILTGNDFPDAEPLIQRLVWNEMEKNIFNSEELKNFDILKDMMREGMSGYAHHILKHRLIIKEQFDRVQRNWKQVFKETFPDAKERMIANMSILATLYQILRDNNIVNFPFSQDEMIKHFGQGVKNQLRRINSGSTINKFWDVFIACLRGSQDTKIQIHREANIEGNHLYIQWSRVYGIINIKWWNMYRNEAPPTKSNLLEQLESSGVVVGKEKVYQFDSGRDGIRSSALKIDLTKLNETLKDDIIMSLSFQLNEGSLFDGDADSVQSEPKLPF